MSANALRGYRFATAAQFDACLFDRADRGGLRAADGLRSFAPFARTATLFETNGGHAPAITRTGELLWRDDDGALWRLPACADAPESFPAPPPIGRATRIIATSRGLWVASSATTLELFEEDTLARLCRVELPGVRIIDLAAGERDGIAVLVERGDAFQIIRVECAGRVTETIELKGLYDAKAFVFLRRAGRFVVLTEKAKRQRLQWFRAQGGAALFALEVGGLRPCFTAHAIGSDTNARLFVAGADDRTFGGKAFVLSFDADGNALGDVPLDRNDVPATGVAVHRDTLLVTGPRGLSRFAAADTIPEGAGEVRATLVTPMLFSPDREDQRRWLRVEATAELPEGATIEIAYAATDDVETRDRLLRLTANNALSATQRIKALRDEPDIWRTPVTFNGQAEAATTPFSAPLFDVRERWLWVAVTLSAAPGSRLPELSELAVLYPGRTLMEHLPAIYQRAESQPGSFLRGLVGVLESTTQGLDSRIASMASLIHPETAPDEWLDFIARWLGLPWDDALTTRQKQDLVRRAPDLARGRGTRAGLEALLEALMPGSPPRFRVVDATADFGFATIGGDGCTGSALPAMLGGRTRWTNELGTRAVLGYMRLPCAGQRDDGAWQLAGKIRIEIAATGEERAAWEPWLLALITEMVPLTVRIDLRWTAAQTLRGDCLGSGLTLGGPPAAQLGTGAVTGLARLPERPPRLSPSGPDTGTRLR